MEKRSNHWGDIGKWIEKVIDSCETYQQTFTARKLISNFEDKLIRDNVSFDIHSNITDSLRYKLDIKRQSFVK